MDDRFDYRALFFPLIFVAILALVVLCGVATNGPPRPRFRLPSHINLPDPSYFKAAVLEIRARELANKVFDWIPK